MAEPLITKYRPISFDEIIGNTVAIKALAEAVKSDTRPHGYLFTGPSGVGKTTLARIIAREVNASIMEIDAASNSGVEDTRSLVELSGYRPITVEQARMYIIDECHALSKQAWSPLLKLIEEPPPFLYISLCTTETTKIPETIKTRCYPVALKSLKPFDIEDLLMTVIELEGWKVDPSVFQGVIQAAEGSARKALSILQAGHALANRDELSQIIMDVESEANPAVKLAGYLLKGGRNWREVINLSKEIENEEEAIMVMTRYFVAAMLRSEEHQAQDIYRMLRAFTEVLLWDKKLQFYTGIGKILWGQIPF